MRRFYVFLLVLLLAAPVGAQFTIPHTFSPLTRAQSSQVNANFSLLANALDRRGGTMTGDLISENIEPGDDDVYALGAADAQFSNVYAVLGTFSGTLTADAFSGSGASLTAIPESAISDGSVLARIAANETISGSWTFGALTTTGTILHTRDSNAQVHNSVRNDNAGASSYAASAVNASGNSWAMRMGSAAANNNALEWAVDALGTPSVQMSLTTGGVLSVVGRINSATAQPGFIAYRNATPQSVDNGDTLVFNATSQNTGSHYSTSTGLFTAPVAGTYIFCARVSFSDTDGDNSGFDFVHSGGTRYDGPITSAMGNHTHCTLAVMSGTDTMRVVTKEGAIGSITLNGDASHLVSYFSGRLMP